MPVWGWILAGVGVYLGLCLLVVRFFHARDERGVSGPWIVISKANFLAALRRVANGEDAEQVFATLAEEAEQEDYREPPE